MAWEIPGFSFTLIAAADLSSSQFCAVNADTTAAGSKAALPSAGGRAIGVIQNKPTAGLPATIVTTGITKGKVGTGGVTAGDSVKALANGTFTTAGTGTYAIGIALQTGVAGVLVPILLTPAGGGGLLA